MFSWKCLDWGYFVEIDEEKNREEQQRMFDGIYIESYL